MEPNCDDDSLTLNASSASTFQRSHSMEDSIASYNLENFTTLGGGVDVDEPDQSFDFVFEKIYGPIDKPELDVSNIHTLINVSKEYDELDFDSDDEEAREGKNQVTEERKSQGPMNIALKKELFLEKIELRSRLQRLKMRTASLRLAQTPKEFIDTMKNRRKSAAGNSSSPTKGSPFLTSLSTVKTDKTDPTNSSTSEPSTEGSTSQQSSHVSDDPYVLEEDIKGEDDEPSSSKQIYRCDSSMGGSGVYIEGRDDEEQDEDAIKADQGLLELIIQAVEKNANVKGAETKGCEMSETTPQMDNRTQDNTLPEISAPPPVELVETQVVLDSVGASIHSNKHLRAFTRVPRRLEKQTERLQI